MIKPEGTMKVITDYGEGLSETVPAVSVETAQKIADEKDELIEALEKVVAKQPPKYYPEWWFIEKVLTHITEGKEK